MQGISGLAEELLVSEEGSGSKESVSHSLLVTSVDVYYLFLMLSITKNVGLHSNISDYYFSGVWFETHPQC